MIQKIKNYFLVVSSALMIAIPAGVPVLVSAADTVCTGGNTTIGDNVSRGANGAAGTGANSNCTEGSSVDDTGLAALGRRVVNIFSLIIGIIAIIMIIYGGFRYITSGGASERVGNAKNTLIYAIVGLIIVALAQVIVHFVLNQTNQAVTGP